MEKIKAGGIIQNLNLAKIGIMGVPDRFGIASIILGAIYNKRINVQYIVTTTDTDNKSSIILCVNNEDLNVTMEAIETIKSQINAENVIFQSNDCFFLFGICWHKYHIYKHINFNYFLPY
jgi:aspartokinase